MASYAKWRNGLTDVFTGRPDAILNRKGRQKSKISPTVQSYVQMSECKNQ